MTSRTHTAVLLFGPPGSGKGTQGRALGALPTVTHYDMGHRLRHVDGDSALGRRIRSATSTGGLLPDDIVLRLFDADLERLVENGNCGSDDDVLLLDGLPRTPGQAKALGARLDVIGVVELAVDDRLVLVERLRQRGLENGRVDDVDVAVIEERVQRFERESSPVIDRFEPDQVKTVDGSNAPLVVLADVVTALSSLLGRNPR